MKVAFPGMLKDALGKDQKPLKKVSGQIQPKIVDKILPSHGPQIPLAHADVASGRQSDQKHTHEWVSEGGAARNSATAPSETPNRPSVAPKPTWWPGVSPLRTNQSLPGHADGAGGRPASQEHTTKLLSEEDAARDGPNGPNETPWISMKWV